MSKNSRESRPKKEFFVEGREELERQKYEVHQSILRALEYNVNRRDARRARERERESAGRRRVAEDARLLRCCVDHSVVVM